MPANVKFKNGQLKHVLRQALGDVLPRSIRERQDKMGFPVPLRQWVGRGGPLHEFASDLLSSQAARSRPYLRAGFDPVTLLDSDTRVRPQPVGRAQPGALAARVPRPRGRVAQAGAGGRGALGATVATLDELFARAAPLHDAAADAARATRRGPLRRGECGAGLDGVRRRRAPVLQEGVVRVGPRRRGSGSPLDAALGIPLAVSTRWAGRNALRRAGRRPRRRRAHRRRALPLHPVARCLGRALRRAAALRPIPTPFRPTPGVTRRGEPPL